MAKSDERQEKIAALLQEAENGIKAVLATERYKIYLKTMAKFHQYSYRNIYLIQSQMPNATIVAGYVAWQDKFKRQIQKGEKGIQIIGYTPRKIKEKVEKKDLITGQVIFDSKGKPQTEIVTKQIPCFTPVYVYDISQTIGQPLPTLANELEGNVNGYDNLISALKEVSAYPIEFEAIKNGVKGYCDPVNQRIAINEGMSEAQTLKTIIHEITHTDLHSPELKLSIIERTDRRTREIEAERVAYVVCNHYNLDTSDYSFGYLASWSSDKELKELQSSLDRIQKEVSELIDRIDYRLSELQKEQNIDILPSNKISKKENISNNENNSTFTIYQLADGTMNNNRRHLSFSELEQQKEKPEIKNYNIVYNGILPTGATVGTIFNEFKQNQPKDYIGNSISISDIIIVNCNGEYSANYIDSIGFKSCPDFAKEHEKLIDIHNDSIKFDSDIDMDKEKTMGQLGFKDYTEINSSTSSDKDNKTPKSMKERMLSAKTEADRINTNTKENKMATAERDV